MRAKNKYPLRKIVERNVYAKRDETTFNLVESESKTKVFANRLECGHLVKPSNDLYGEVHTDRQRCKYCITDNF